MPDMGKNGFRCLVEDFFAELPDKDLQYSVLVTPEVASQGVDSTVMSQCISLYRNALPTLVEIQSILRTGTLYARNPQFYIGRNISVTPESSELKTRRNSIGSCFKNHFSWQYCPTVQAVCSYAHSGSSYYDLFGNGKPGDKKFRKARESTGEYTGLWTGSDEDEGTTKKNQNHLEENIRNGSGKQGDGKFIAWEETDEDTGLWTRSDKDEDIAKKNQSHLKEEIRKTKQEAEKRAQLIDADDSDELRSVWSGSDEDKTLWSGPECNDDDDIPTKPFPNEQSDAYLEKLFEFEETPKYRTIAEIYKDEEREELSPGKQARKVAVENALKKLKKGPDGRYINVWEVISDIDILIGAFENIVSGLSIPR
ncbi:hypothetical protein GIB67_041221 [Kingdonia uniflora]|uniref:Uncharacterized protein n=1 Tax=Kingdonia uniflora TaxID=39325 RepID=A0A7J7L212_9MAGN|nr:hypothetical protein GIB67_041221 [Kingdonia uniflora]